MCPLCQLDKSIHFSKGNRRSFLQCSVCKLVYVEEQYILSKEEEKAIYDLHENDVNDMGYRKFLCRLADPLVNCVTDSSHGLDFGCGPGPALAKMLEEKGFHMSLYDLYYYPDEKVLNQQYDFITSTEVVEHIKDLNALFDLLSKCLKETGVLGIMTKLVIDQEAFSKWHYKNDQTHIRFFSKETFEWIAKNWKFSVNFYGNDVIVLSRI